MKKFTLACLSILAVVGVFAQDGPYSGTSFTVVAIPGSSNTWIKTDSAGSSDNAYARFGNLPPVAGTFTDYLVISNFLFAIPPNAVISGIEVYIERSDPTRRTSDYSIRIVKNGVIGSQEKSGGTGYAAFDSYQLYGSLGDLWGETWTNNDINDPGFGVAIAARRNAPTSTTGGRIDDVQIIVYWDFMITPVTLLSFTAAKKDKDVEVKWATSDEVHMDHYEIERSTDGRHFNTIGTVNSEQQLSKTDYIFYDRNPLSGASYYRLKMIGDAGYTRYSRIVSMRTDQQNRIALYPNPLQYGQTLNLVTTSNDPYTINFYTMAGQYLSGVSTNGTTIPVQGIQNQRGILFYSIIEKNGHIAGTGKLVIQ